MNYAARIIEIASHPLGSEFRTRSAQLEFLVETTLLCNYIAAQNPTGEERRLAVAALYRLQLEIGEIVWNDHIPLSDAISCIDAFAHSLTTLFAFQDEFSQELAMAWDGVINFTKPESERTDRLEAAIAAKLEAQLASTNRQMQLSAIAGLALLGPDAACPVFKLSETMSGLDDELHSVISQMSKAKC